ncbi:hypothetical protein KUTeg_007920, partial [Tegillarca granosa]
MSGVFSFDLTILHTNDVHSRINEINTFVGRCTDTEGKCYGGIARQKTLIDRLRQENPNTLLMDAGDQFQGTLWFYKYGGELYVQIIALGNHEFDRNIDGLIPFLRNASFPVVSSNIDASKEHKLQQGMYKPYHVYYKVVGSLIFTDEVAAIRKNVKILQSQNINKIIALGHSGFKVDRRIAEEVEGIDIVVGGHTNTFLYTGLEYINIVCCYNDALPYIRQASSNEKPVGVYPTVVKQRCKSTRGSRLHIREISRVFTNEYLKNITKEFGTLLTEELNQVVGRTPVHLEGDRFFCRVKECNIGNLIADGLVHQNLKYADSINYTHVFISLVNGGSIRSTFERDKSLRNCFLRIVYDLSKNVGSRLVSVHVKCADCKVPESVPLEDNKIYDLTLPRFVLNGGDGYTMTRDHAIQVHII